MDDLVQRISEKKKQLASLRPFPPELEKNLYEWNRVAVTYASNALEGNTLSMAETAQVVEKHLTVSGKSITEHLEAVNHAQAIDGIHQLSITKSRAQLTVRDILDIHAIILQKINDQNAGAFRTVAVRVTGSPVPCPNYMKVPELMDDLVATMTTSQDRIITIAAWAHLQLVSIYPFVDGNGRTARLLMNLLLLQDDFPLVNIEPQDRATYVGAIQKALTGQTGEYYRFIYTAIEKALDMYLDAARESNLTVH